MTVNLEPTPDGYEAIARRFVSSCAADARDDRRTSCAHVLGGLINLIAYLATLPDGAARIERLEFHAVAVATAAELRAAREGRAS